MSPQFYFTMDIADLVLPGPWKEQVAFLMDVRDGTCFRVDTATDMLTTDELFRHSALVQAADEREIKSFVDDKVFQLIRRQDAPVRPMDCLWVRKWKRKPTANDPGEVKSRLVVRGFLDSQRDMQVAIAVQLRACLKGCSYHLQWSMGLSSSSGILEMPS